MGLDETTTHRSTIESALQRLGCDPIEFRFERLSDGQSGSAVWWLELDGRPLVLKISAPVMLKRARRELGFYRDLAAHVPLKVPQLIGQAMDADGVVLLLTASSPAPSLDAWTERDFQQVASDLGTLHGTWWGQDHHVVLPGWLQPASGVSEQQAATAQAIWPELNSPPGLERLRDAMVQLAGQVPTLHELFATLPPTLCHGDAHRDNLLRADSGEWIWADWQEVRLGQGVDDLAFFWQRAFAIKETIPAPERLIEAYRDGLVRAGVTSISREELSQAVSWSELRMWAIDWPPYLGWLAPTVLERVLRRCEQLTGALDIDLGPG